MAKSKTIRVYTSFPMKEDWIEVSKNLNDHAKEFYGQSGDSGAGFGGRDISFNFNDLKNAKSFITSVKKNFKKNKVMVGLE